MTFKTWDGLIEYLQDIRDNDPAPLYEARIEWEGRNKYSEVDLVITENGPVEQHTMIYDGNTYEISITTRDFKADNKGNNSKDTKGNPWWL